MRIFVTGASGFVGSAVVPELLGAGHQVLGLARSDASARYVADLGADVHRGDLEDLESLRGAAAACDGVIHLAFIHDFSRFAEVSRIDRDAIEVLGSALEGSNRPLVVASGFIGLASGRVATERDLPEVDASVMPRLAGSDTALAFVSRGVRSSLVRLSASVHDEGDHGFLPTLIDIARKKGVSGYIGDGSNRWPAVHRRDAAKLFRLAAESAPAASVLHGVGDGGIPTRTIAQVIGRHLGVPVRSISADDAEEHFGWMARFFAYDCPASNTITRELLGWEPSHIGLIEDLERGHYFKREAEPIGT